MQSAIGLATARQLRVGGRLSVYRAARFAVHATGQSTTAIPSGYRVAAIFNRGFAQFAKKLATTTKKTPAKKKKTTKKAAAKKAAEKKAAAKRAAAKKAAAAKLAALSDEEKLKIKIKALKKKALLTEPTRRGETAWAVFMSRALKDRLSGKPTSETGSFATALPDVAKEFKALPAAEVEKLAATARENKLSNEIALKSWVESHTPQEISDANVARKTLKRVYKIPAGHTIKDPRVPDKPSPAFGRYIKSRWASLERPGDMSVSDGMKKLLEEWRNLNDAERQING
ncbi:hypothetical protein MMYC01_200521 [Madurella mycetomatis]|uniref:HMG box domain-containing protein n=1 Tax=Madurella mycetomatis TaxID=100816 RepID=A0A175WGV6_9PEZI|nr:hypothetical protein MMYC01_200521 [Madurella mycetomatis]